MVRRITHMNNRKKADLKVKKYKYCFSRLLSCFHTCIMIFLQYYTSSNANENLRWTMTSSVAALSGSFNSSFCVSCKTPRIQKMKLSSLPTPI